MNVKNLIGASLCVAIFAISFLGAEGAAQFFNLVGLFIVLSGTLGATFLSYPAPDVRNAVQVAWNSYRIRPVTASRIVNTLLDISVRSRRDGLLSLQSVERQTEVSFLKNALGMLVDGFQEREMRDILLTEMHFFRRRRQQHERVFRHMARLAPAFGVAGSVVGLIGMVAGIGDTTVILRTIPIALTSTLYGIVLSNFVLTPVAENINFKTQKELLLKKLILDGVAAVMEERNSHKLEKKLNSFLTPAQRPENERTFEEIRKKYYKLRLEGEAAQS